MIKRAVIGVAAAALLGLGGGQAFAATAPAGSAGTDAWWDHPSHHANTATAESAPTTLSWTWVNGSGNRTFVTAAGWFDKHREDVL
ncbi:hypothetical protein P3T27_004318 [Kitasatospora sp. MAA19]|uniref:hypothetical protein n=1 Tax=unclassified Kitasatospora TaxID=2633591 RepID=UPI002473E7A4|nr:hypothetical protein [Kitasatospora sp. MAA19]MDH6707581.1 hypothetical protein [Kitasatospora sp. MAA19]